MILWGVAAQLATAQPVSWEEMARSAAPLAPLEPAEPVWSTPLPTHSADLIHPLGAGRLLVGHLELSPGGIPRPGTVTLWDTGTDTPLWSVSRPHTQGMLWRVISTQPLVLAGQSPRESVLLSLDVDTGAQVWSTSAEHERVVATGSSAVVWRRGVLEAIAYKDGSTVWTLPVSRPTAVHRTERAVVVESADGVVSVDTAWGAEDWRHAGDWRVSPAADGTGAVLYSPQQIQWIDGFGELRWSWVPPGPVVSALAVDGRALIATSSAGGDLVSVLEQGAVIGSLTLGDRVSSPLQPINGVVVLTTDRELVAISPLDGAVAFRSELPDPLPGWGPSRHPELPHGQLDVLHVQDEDLVVIRERAGIASFHTSSFDAGGLAWSQPHAVVGADAMSVGGRFLAMSDAMDAPASPSVDGVIAQRRMEFEAALRRASAPVVEDHYLRPFHRAGARGITLVNLRSGDRTDVLYAPLLPQVPSVDLPALHLDLASLRLWVAGPDLDPTRWRRIALGGLEQPGPTLRGYALGQLGFAPTSATLEALAELEAQSSAAPPEPGAIAAPPPSSPTDRLEAAGGPSWATCVELGILGGEDPDIVQACLDADVPLAQPGDAGQLALVLAAGADQLENVRMLLDAGADVDAPGPGDPRPPLELASDPEVIALLAQRGGRERSKKEKKRDLKDLLSLAGLRKPNGAWCLHHVSKGRRDVLEACLDSKRAGLLEHVDPQLGHALHVAADAGWPSVVRMLLDAGADPWVRDAEGLTPLDHLEALDTLTEGQQEAARWLELAMGR
ncbi:MAG TPA: hypothetical protein ENK18_19240 [Deltaproteobacteria bacterium]|nr:hypothetical protein [Deltaproteobacteria bacterium]